MWLICRQTMLEWSRAIESKLAELGVIEARLQLLASQLPVLINPEVT